ncbi:MAG: hypothetical protein C4520_06710 [Candidatus Abyssobacteria bacterium SURF_5]|uniref:Glycosyltransferase RgtA/B/C/D-like domain-containing protein n=1 Tax=Abyssobacteria bacterium (strain SURF_5) TaxID=2093360 RepID=A0A3A4NWI9_ABYX5|nr:MAG: hypothetical protein C4520_06710 [Candidatus Abyssubacteria bacterium SURF_5]
MDYVLVILQGLFGIFILIVPALELLALFSERKLPHWPAAFLFAGAFLVSSVFIAGLQMISLSLPSPFASRILAYLLLASIAAIAWQTKVNAFRELIARFGVWERRSLMFLAIVTAFWLVSMPLSPYPSHLNVQLGDTPVYYHTAANLVSGKGWAADYFSADYVGGTLSYVEKHPILILITSYFFLIFGPNFYSLYVYNTIAAAILIYLIVSVACNMTDKSFRDGPHIFLLGAIVALLPAHFLLFGLGAITVPGGLAFLTLAASVLVQDIRRNLRILLVLTSLAFMFWSRPESALLALIVIGMAAMRFLFVHKLRSFHVRAGVAAACLFLAVLVWRILPNLLPALPDSLSNLSILYSRYHASSGIFLPVPHGSYVEVEGEPLLGDIKWWELSRLFCRLTLSGVGPKTLVNPEIGDEIQAHPWAFFRMLLYNSGSSAFGFVHALGSAQSQFEWLRGFPSFGILAVFLVLMSLTPGGAFFAAAIAIFLFVIPAFNYGIEIRHMLAVTPTALAFALRPFFKSWQPLSFESRSNRWLLAVGGCLVLTLTGANAWNLLRIRSAPENTSYVKILEDIEEMSDADDLIASSYPQLISCMTGRKSVGGTWLTENIDFIVNRYHPDFILIDDARDGPKNYAEFERNGSSIPGYAPIKHNANERYIILRSIWYASSKTKETN